MSCRKGGFINILHKNVRDLTAKLLSVIRHDVQVEPALVSRWNILPQLKPTKQGWTLEQEDLDTCTASIFRCFTTIEKEKNITITNALCKSNKEPSAPYG